MLRGLRDLWAGRHDDEPIEARGVTLADGNGKEGVATALDMCRLGYSVGLLRDSDESLTKEEAGQLAALGIEVFEWDGATSTEERIFLDVSGGAVQVLLDIAGEYFGAESVLDTVRGILETKDALPAAFASWQVEGKGEVDFRRAIGLAAKKKGWFKLVERGERVGLVVAAEVAANAQSPLAKTLTATEAWAYG